MKLDTATETLSGTGILIPDDGRSHGDCAINSAATLAYVTARTGVIPIDLATGSAGLAIPVIGTPDDLDLTPDGRYVLVSKFNNFTGDIGNLVDSDDSLTVIETSGNTVIGDFLPASRNAHAVDVCDDGSSVVVGDQGDDGREGRLTLLSLSSLGALTEVTSAPALRAFNVYCAPGSRAAIAINGNVRSFIIPALTPVSISTFLARSAVFSPSGTRLYMRHFESVRAVTFDPVTCVIGDQLWMTTVTGGTGVFGREELAVSSDGTKLYLTEESVVRVLDAATGMDLTTLSNADLTIGKGICLQASSAGPPPPPPGGGGGGPPPADITPDPFAFATQANVQRNSVRTSNIITITGIDTGVPISVIGGTYSIGCTGAFTAAASTINSGQTVCLRHTSSSNPVASVSTTLSVGGVAGTFTSSTTKAASAIQTGTAVFRFGLANFGTIFAYLCCPPASTLTIVGDPSAVLRDADTGVPLAGRYVRFFINIGSAPLCTAVTNSAGVATCRAP